MCRGCPRIRSLWVSAEPSAFLPQGRPFCAAKFDASILGASRLGNAWSLTPQRLEWFSIVADLILRAPEGASRRMAANSVLGPSFETAAELTIGPRFARAR